MFVLLTFREMTYNPVNAEIAKISRPRKPDTRKTIKAIKERTIAESFE